MRETGSENDRGTNRDTRFREHLNPELSSESAFATFNPIIKLGASPSPLQRHFDEGNRAVQNLHSQISFTVTNHRGSSFMFLISCLSDTHLTLLNLIPTISQLQLSNAHEMKLSIRVYAI